MFRFFVEKREGNSFSLSVETLNHLKVARIRNEHFICVYQERFYECQLNGNHALIINEVDENHEFNHEVVIALAIINFKRFEWAIQKCTELGATKFIPLLSQNVQTKYLHGLNNKIGRWNEISSNASEQSFRNKKMIVTNPMTLTELWGLNYQNKFIAHEKESLVQKNASALFDSPVLFVVGPEGGFTDDEINLAIKNNFSAINLGSRILRSETAAIFLVSRTKS